MSISLDFKQMCEVRMDKMSMLRERLLSQGVVTPRASKIKYIQKFENYGVYDRHNNLLFCITSDFYDDLMHELTVVCSTNHRIQAI